MTWGMNNRIVRGRFLETWSRPTDMMMMMMMTIIIFIPRPLVAFYLLLFISFTEVYKHGVCRCVHLLH
jgi:hypothetical protein